MPFPIGFRRRPYNTLELPHECVIIGLYSRIFTLHFLFCLLLYLTNSDSAIPSHLSSSSSSSGGGGSSSTSKRLLKMLPDDVGVTQKRVYIKKII